MEKKKSDISTPVQSVTIAISFIEEWIKELTRDVWVVYNKNMHKKFAEDLKRTSERVADEMQRLLK